MPGRLDPSEKRAYCHDRGLHAAACCGPSRPKYKSLISFRERRLRERSTKTRALDLQYYEQNDAAVGLLQKFRRRPTAEQYAAMCLASRYGPGGPLSEGGEPFALEYVFDEANSALEHTQRAFVDLGQTPDVKPGIEPQYVGGISSQAEPFGSLVFTTVVDEVLLPYLSKFDPDEFAELEELRGIYPNRASGQIGLELVVQTMVPLNDVQKFHSARPPCNLGADQATELIWTAPTGNVECRHALSQRYCKVHRQE